ncbi:hypothetical protein ACS0ZG_07015 [Burkholderia gladioli]|uniref:hypothetical protein n=1 Tax=Burkholderia gladioli TaxID=28095 RepID=UPI003F7A49F3
MDLDSKNLPSLGELVLRKRKWRAAARLLAIIGASVTTLFCVDFLWPLFLPADYTNPAIAKFVTSDSFNKNTGVFFESLKKYNNREPGEAIKKPDDFYVVDNSNYCLLISFHYHLIKTESDESAADSINPQYHYDPNISIKIYWPQLAGIIAIIFFEILFTLFLLRKDHKAEIDSEEKILNNYFDIEKYFQKTPTVVESQLGSSDGSSASRQSDYVHTTRIAELRALPAPKLDPKRLIRLLEELNNAHAAACYMATAMLVRAITDHVPPVFGMGNFAEVASNYAGGKSFKGSMQHLQNSLRNIADAHLHTQIRKSESLPTEPQVDFRGDLDVLLGEVVRVLNTSP